MYHGFDISDAQFPASNNNNNTDPGTGIGFSVQDCLKPFPEEHHGQYDLVHVRLLVAAVKEVDYALIVANIKPLLSIHFPPPFIQF